MIDFHKLIEKPMKAVNAAIDLAERTHGALAAVLVEALPALIEIRKDEADFADFAEREYNVTVTGNAVDATGLRLIKTIFHGVSPKFDFRKQYNHLCIALLHLEQQKVPPEHAAQYIRDVGGISACVKAYRKANNRNNSTHQEAEFRRVQAFLKETPTIGETVTTASGDSVLVINKAKDNNALPALAQQPGRLLLVADIDQDFNLTNLRIVGRDQVEIDRLLARKAREAAGTHGAEPSAANDNTKLNTDTIEHREAA